MTKFLRYSFLKDLWLSINFQSLLRRFAARVPSAPLDKPEDELKVHGKSLILVATHESKVESHD